MQFLQLRNATALLTLGEHRLLIDPMLSELFGWLLGPVAGCYLAHPDEPSVLLTSDAILTDELRATIERLRPDLIVAPAGAANFGLGPDILFSADELAELARLAPGRVIFNHLEAVDHCPVTRADLRARMQAEGLADKVEIPADGESIELAGASPGAPATRRFAERPGLQKWLTAKFAGT